MRHKQTSNPSRGFAVTMCCKWIVLIQINQCCSLITEAVIRHSKKKKNYPSTGFAVTKLLKHSFPIFVGLDSSL
jgi:hypothetical protein